MDETRIDAAPTPAHIFAYRAFRSVFVRSPESSPVRPPPTEPQHPNDNKENARDTVVRGSRFVTSPVRAKRDAELASETLNLALTPKRQCVNTVSPTKSILKKSNVLTPRRAGLRDVTVTFKDVRMSTSPELTRKGSPTRVRSQPDLRSTLATLSSVGLNAPVLGPTSANWTDGKATVAKDETVPRTTTDFDLDAYIAQTEKEMRRLIKYGQKWREQAKKQEQENARLQARLEKLQKENNRLRREDRAVPESAGFQLSTDVTRPSVQVAANAKESKSTVDSFRRDSQVRRGSQEKWKVPFANIDTAKQRSTSSNPSGQAQQPSEPQLEVSRAKQTTSRREPHARTNSEEMVHKRLRPVSNEIDRDPPRHEEKTRQSNDRSTVKQDQLPMAEDAPEQFRPTSELMTEEDRKAAARERLRLKREAKVASVRASSAPMPQSQKYDQDMRGDNEESQVDWMAIA